MTARDMLADLLRREAKTNTYKFALIRALNDLVLDYPLLPAGDVVVPLRHVAERWLVYYWPFVGKMQILQGARSLRVSGLTQDLSFRPALSALRAAWEGLPGTDDDPAAGALLLADYRVGRRRLPPEVERQTEQVLKVIAQAVKQPVRYAGGRGPHALFSVPGPAGQQHGVPLPGILPTDTAFTVPANLWQALQESSLWVEALCLHEWCLFADRLPQDTPVTRGDLFTLLTASPAGRVPLTWERHQVKLLMLGGRAFQCPWTAQLLHPDHFALDHLIPVSAQPINELWNLLPSDPAHNAHVKRHRVPDGGRLEQARRLLSVTYRHYEAGALLSPVLRRDMQARFGQVLSPERLAAETISLADRVAQARNLPRS
ncbi:hypothetical protein E7T06_07950 [Deinococcus sp. Arct2-2]|uniref:hypothetical protein n=1 Tax=Deinococcus sp. Arct2-2 TaxID=2568653 RepID=UPI0010A2EDCF|nr:hypothetical protein [Deinococcus sp. Arct2-2]THF70387.1 hypothetical protein E7T06_07950 [Deinococcus sp. Arct2-2]